MKKKLSELNRVPFAEAFRKFCQYYSVNLDDLWTVVSDENEMTLLKIRNHLVHGGSYDESDAIALFYARESLKGIIQRMILRLLGWSVEKSEISPEILYGRRFYAYTKWRDEQKSLFKK